MADPILHRRYLYPLRAARLPQQVADVLVVGGGVAGLRAAIAAADAGAEVLLLAKDTVAESNTWYAQGGIAAVLQPLDSVESHIEDTLRVGVGLCDEPAVRVTVEEGPRRVLELLSWGANFDKQIGNPYDLAFGMEGGHSFARILHAFGDATGRELATTLINTVRERDSIRISEKSFAIDVITEETPAGNGHREPGRGPSHPPPQCLGVLAMVGEQMTVIWARQTILATGGAGQLFRESTNPRIATGDGLAMAWRAGAALRDMEMVQFHPTTLYVAGSSRALITEAIRGEGAYLRDRTGHRFMPDYHPDAELAPRDVVSRAIVQQIRKTNYSHVYLDVRHLDAQKFARRFPGITRMLGQFDIDPAKDQIPIHPATHYMIGGIDVDLEARTGVPGLFAVGECACTGLHGANRLASNSLLEGLTFGARAGEAAARAAAVMRPDYPKKLRHDIPASDRTELDVADVKSSLRSVMWRNAGIEREGERLTETGEIIAFWSRYVMDKVFDPGAVGLAAAAAGWELQNMLCVCSIMTSAAQARTESRGAHFRLDHPDRDDEHWRLHLAWKRPTATPIPQPVT
ncbi:MAG: L-aspartate oxidase [Phycisphaerae bacterium]